MYKRLLLLFYILLLMAGKSHAQINLVPNPSFEDTIHCVTQDSQFQGFVKNWMGLDLEYFSEICQGSLVQVPSNGFGYQWPRTGKAYAGIYTRIVDTASAFKNYRDYIEVQLIDTLKPNKSYCTSFHLSLANKFKYSCNDIGAYFSSSMVTPTNNVIPVSPQVYNLPISNPLNDTMNWKEVNGMFQSLGSEIFLTIGNFHFDSISSTILAYPSSSISASYYFIDDVSVIQVPVADAGPDHVICTMYRDSVLLGSSSDPGVQYHWHPAFGLSDTSIAQPYAKPSVTTTYYLTITDTVHCTCTRKMSDTVKVTVSCNTATNPAHPPVIHPETPPVFGYNTIIFSGQTFFIKALEPGTRVTLFNALGQLIFDDNNYQNNLLADQISSGIYFYRLTLPDGTERKGKLCVVH